MKNISLFGKYDVVRNSLQYCVAHYKATVSIFKNYKPYIKRHGHA